MLDCTHANVQTVRTVELHPGDLLADGARVIDIEYRPHGVWLAIVLTLLAPGVDGPEVIVDGEPDTRSGAYSTMPAVDRYTVVRRAASVQVYDAWTLPPLGGDEVLCSACGQFDPPERHDCLLRPALSTVPNA